MIWSFSNTKKWTTMGIFASVWYKHEVLPMTFPGLAVLGAVPRLRLVAGALAPQAVGGLLAKYKRGRMLHFGTT